MADVDVLRTRLSARGPLIAPGAYDGLSARVVEQAGFDAVYVSGGAVARSTGVPDLGLLAMTEVRDRTAQICRATTLPVIADVDTGYGNALNVLRTVDEFVRAGVSAVQIEDQVAPKKCGHYGGKELVGAAEMAGKVTAAVEAADGRALVVARTDAVAVEGLDAALDRARRYRDAGADVLFVEAPESVDDVLRVGRELGPEMPLLINMFEGGRTPAVGLDELGAAGYRLVIIPSDLQRAAIHAMRRVAAEILRSGDSSALRDELTTFDERDEIVGKSVWDARETRFAAG